MAADLPAPTLRLMTASDLDACMELTELAGWNQLRGDWETILALRPDGCFVACQADGIVGTATTTAYGNAFGWIGMVIVHSDCRRRGIGRALLRRCIDSLAHCAAAKLDATPTGKRLYDNLGFVDEYFLGRYVAQTPIVPKPVALPGVCLDSLLPADLPAVAAFDTPYFGIDRGAVLAAWQRRTPDYAFVAKQAEEIVGYCLGRPGLNYETIGPVVALDGSIAQALVARVLGQVAPRAAVLDAYEHTPDFLAWLSRFGFVKQRPFIRMYRGENAHPGNTAHLYALCGPEVG
jgi:GNAT superfamily N-acetyltransferase